MLHFGEERGGRVGLSKVLREDVDGDVMGLLQLRLESEQALLTASDKDKVAPQGSMQAGISFAEPTGSPRDEGGLSVIHTMVKRGFCAPKVAYFSPSKWDVQREKLINCYTKHYNATRR